MIPQLRGWHARYEREGLTVIGVHTPEFAWEKPARAVAEARERLGIRYPVLQDNDATVWRRFGVWAWPTLVLVDRRGVIRYRHVGEGGYDATATMIRRLLAESRGTGP